MWRRREPRGRRYQLRRRRNHRRANAVDGIEIEVLLRRDKRAVGPVESGADEERSILVLLEQRDRLRGDLAVRMRPIRRGRCVVRQRAAETPIRCEVRELGLFVLVDSARIHDRVPRRRIVESARADVPGIAVVIDLADPGHDVAVALEHLRQRHRVGQNRPEVGLQFVDPGCVRTQACEQRHTTRAAQRKLVVRPIEPHAAPRQTIEMGRLHDRVTVRPEVGVQIVRHDQQNVWSALSRGGRRHEEGRRRHKRAEPWAHVLPRCRAHQTKPEIRRGAADF